jgi:hypothetical protein
VVQDYVLYKTDRYKAALAASYGIEPVELEMGLKKWVDDRLQKAVDLINRTSIAQEKQLEEAEAELTAVVSDLEALSRRDKFRDELVARYGQYINRERSLAGLRKIEIITGYTLAGKKIPEAPTNPRTVQNLVPSNWRPWWVEKDRTSGDYVEIPDFSNPMNLGPGRILEEGEEFSPLEGPSLRELHELAPSSYQVIE